MKGRREERLNTLLREVISEVIRTKVRNPSLPPLLTITKVAITKDLRHAKVYVSLIGASEERKQGVKTLQSAAGFIGFHASKQIVIRYFPELTFLLDNAIEKQQRIDQLLLAIKEEREPRGDE